VHNWYKAEGREGLLQVAAAVAKEALEVGVARTPRPQDLLKYIEERMWEPGKQELDPSIRTSFLT
jgi:malic enzyme